MMKEIFSEKSHSSLIESVESASPQIEGCYDNSITISDSGDNVRIGNDQPRLLPRTGQPHNNALQVISTHILPPNPLRPSDAASLINDVDS